MDNNKHQLDAAVARRITALIYKKIVNQLTDSEISRLNTLGHDWQKAKDGVVSVQLALDSEIQKFI